MRYGTQFEKMSVAHHREFHALPFLVLSPLGPSVKRA
jgi:hypothetical protein